MIKNIVVTVILIGLVQLSYGQNIKKIYARAEQQISLLHDEAVKNRSGRLIFPSTGAKDSAKLVASGRRSLLLRCMS